MNITLYVTADTHIQDDNESEAKLHVRNMNHFLDGGKTWPAGTSKAGMPIEQPRSVLLGGDINQDRGFFKPASVKNLTYELYSGTKQTGDSLIFPVYPGFGNHDWDPLDWKYTYHGNSSNRGTADFITRTIKGRPEIVSVHHVRKSKLDVWGWLKIVSAPPLYSWNWEKLHFVSINTYLWEKRRTIQWFGATKGLKTDNGGQKWLENDLLDHVQTFGANAPIIILQHYGYNAGTDWWSDEDRTKLDNILEDYNVIAIFSGHTHSFGHCRTPQGIDNYITEAGWDYVVQEIGGFLVVNITDTTQDIVKVEATGTHAFFDSKTINTKSLNWSGQRKLALSNKCRTKTAPAITFFNGKLYCAWMQPGKHQYIHLASTSDGTNWIAEQTLKGIGTQKNPTLATLNGKIYCAWNGYHNDGVFFASFDGSNWSGQQKLALSDKCRSKNAPAITFLNNKLYCAWMQPGKHQYIHLASTSDGTNWDAEKTLKGIGTQKSPTLATLGGRMYCAWNGYHNDGVFFASFDGSNWSGQQKLALSDKCRSKNAPAIAFLNNKLYCTWMQPGKHQYIHLASTSDGTNWITEQTLKGIGTQKSPSLATLNGKIYCAWNGYHNDGVFYSFCE